MSEQDFRYQRAKERVAALRGFYIHLTVFVVVNLVLVLINLIVTPSTFWFIWPLLGWGIGIALHALFVFGLGQVFGAGWEERKIKELMEEEN